MHILTALNGKFTRFSKKCFYKLSRWHFVEAITLFVWKSLDLKTKKSYSMTEKAGASMPFFTKEKKKRFCISKYLSEEADQWAITVWAKATDTCSAESLTVRGEVAWMLISVLSNDEEGAGATRKMQALQTLVGKIKRMLVTLHVCLTHPLTSQWWSAATNCSLKWPHHLYSIEFSSHSFYIIDAYLSAHHWTD